MKRVFVCLILFSVFIACKSGSSDENKIRIENKTNKNIACVLGYNYPDLSLGFINKKALFSKTELHDSYVLSSEVEQGSKPKVIDTLGLCKKEVWDNTIKHSMLMLFVFDIDKLAKADKPEDALMRRYYFTYTQLMKTNGVIIIDSTRTNNL